MLKSYQVKACYYCKFYSNKVFGELSIQQGKCFVDYISGQAGPYKWVKASGTCDRWEMKDEY